MTELGVDPVKMVTVDLVFGDVVVNGVEVLAVGLESGDVSVCVEQLHVMLFGDGAVVEHGGHG